MVRWSDPKEETKRLERNEDPKQKVLIGEVTRSGKSKYYGHQGHYGNDGAYKRFLMVRLDNGKEQKVMAEECYMTYYFEHVRSITRFENVEEVQVGDRVVIEVGPRWQGKEWVHTNRIFKETIESVLMGTNTPKKTCEICGAGHDNEDKCVCTACWNRHERKRKKLEKELKEAESREMPLEIVDEEGRPC